MPAKSAPVKSPVIEALNRARAAELGAIYQYMSQHYELADKDYGQLAAQFKLIAIDEMRHAEMLAERILVLGGIPTSTPEGEVRKRQPVGEMVAYDRQLEVAALSDYNESLQVCRQHKDSVSARLFETLVDEEQLHHDYFQDVENHVQELGHAYLATLVGGAAEAGPPARGFVAAQTGGAPKG